MQVLRLAMLAQDDSVVEGGDDGRKKGGLVAGLDRAGSFAALRMTARTNNDKSNGKGQCRSFDCAPVGRFAQDDSFLGWVGETSPGAPSIRGCIANGWV
jgi:hypothetical protein